MRTLFLTLLLIILKSLPVISQPKYEIRATWLTTLGGMDWPRTKAGSATGIQRQKKELCDILDRLKAANFNTVLLQTRLRGDMIYPSSIETFAESLTGYTGRNPGYDPLAFAIEECHKRGMELHAWIVTIPAGNTRQVKLLGRNSIVQRNRKICKLYKGNWYLDPGNPETKEYLSRIVKEITSQYDIDGIHFDYIRYPEQADKFPDKDTYRRYGKGKELKQWRRDNITDIVRRLLPPAEALLYLCGLAGICAANYIIFSIATLYYIGYPLLAAYTYFAVKIYFKRAKCNYTCGKCGAGLRHKGICPQCGAMNT